MARKRTIDPDIWSDEKVASLSMPAALFYIGSISNADDLGRIEWSAIQLRGRIFPVREEVTSADVASWMAEVVKAELVLTYGVFGRTYAVHPRWKKHQHVSKPTPSKLPAPPQSIMELIEARIPGNPGESRGFPVPSVSETVTVLELDLRDAREALPKKSDATEPRESAGALTGVVDRSASPAIAFAEWFVAEAISAGALTGVVDEVAHAWRELEIAGRLLAAHGRDECAARSHRLFAAHLSSGRDRIYRPPSLAALKAWWDSPQLAGRPLRMISSAPQEHRPDRTGTRGWRPPARKRGFWTLADDGVTRQFVERSA